MQKHSFSIARTIGRALVAFSALLPLVAASVLAGSAVLNPEFHAEGDGSTNLSEIRPSVGAPLSIFAAAPGPWGALDYYYTYLEPPDHIVAGFPRPTMTTVWSFPGVTPLFLETFFKALELPESQAADLLDTTRWKLLGDDMINVSPSDDTILGLNEDARRRIYEELARSPDNPYHNSPFVIESGDVTEWLSNAGQRPEIIELIDRLSYRVGGGRRFSDYSFVLGKLSDDDEERRLVRALSRTRTLVLRLQITPETDPAALENYWTSGFKYQDVLPIMRSVFQTSGVDFLDVVHLLPPTPRKLLFTFPAPQDGLSGILPDCHWTSANFFQYYSSDRFLDLDVVTRFFSEKFTRVGEPSRFGDVIFLRKDGSKVIHSCVFIADDIVFTKNGRHPSVPWNLMKLGDVLARYEHRLPFELITYRPKD